MFKIKYNVGDHWYAYDFLFQTEWAANLNARTLRDAMRTDVVVVEADTNLVIAHYYAD